MTEQQIEDIMFSETNINNNTELNPIIVNFISKHTDKNYNDICMIYDFLNKHVDFESVEINGDIMVSEYIYIPKTFTKIFDIYPIEEWTETIELENKNYTIIFGLDWFGVRRCSDKGYYVIIN
jgi:hypothetical protein